MELEISQRIFEKSSNIKFHENLSSGSRVVSSRQTDGRTDGHEESNSHFWQFYECAY